ncbi:MULTISPECIES: succinate dehydrogenase cytochrome b subunit [Actinomycetaceae]|uniref:succinate dehydrogenase cytochrome b subunit n=1 Tax=Actinomycetaceae TaxID=2049 RepID=UPI0026591F72|nr:MULTISPECIES: succinate dehydrogenase cytochrome b subunit [Actinomycetaceae]MDK7144063.1 succinate dehydrogenase cytochrome b subunit [Gleimia europaea]MDU7239561.1 succinate dehydrogenase cytochrome b subunit [Actinomyces sp.]
MTVHGRVWQPREKAQVFPTWAAKLAMSITGLVMLAFVFVHMLGNLKIFASHEDYNAYSKWLREAFTPLLPYEGLLWIARIVLGACLLIHVLCALLVWRRSRANTANARPKGLSGYFAKMMLPTGIVLLAFVFVHILDLTVGALVQPASFQHPDEQFYAATNMIASLDRPVMAVFYLIVLLALAIHLAHGFELAINDLGVTSSSWRKWMRLLGILLAILILVGDAAVVLSANLGAV